MRLSVGATNVRTGNFVYFDTTTHEIRPEHIMASGALPPGFPPVEIEGEFYWDGGIVSNTPLQWVLDSRPREDTLAFQVDLWSARGEVPRDLTEVDVRTKEIRYSSRTRLGTDQFKKNAAAAPRGRSPAESSCQAIGATIRSGNCSKPRRTRKCTTSSISSIAPADTKAPARILNSHAGRWKSIGAPAITTPCGRLRHPEVLRAPDQRRRLQHLRSLRGRARVGAVSAIKVIGRQPPLQHVGASDIGRKDAS